jgi:hypothetical protein
MHSKAGSQVIKPTNDPYVANNNHTHSVSGPRTIEAKELSDLVHRDPTTTCTNAENPQPNISVLTALMDDLSLAAEDEMANVPLVSDDESDDGWSVVSEGDDFVVIDSAETSHRKSSKPREESEVLRKPSKQARPSTPDPRQRSVVICQNDREEPVMMLAVQNSGEKKVAHRQQRVGIGETENPIEESGAHHFEVPSLMVDLSRIARY